MPGTFDAIIKQAMSDATQKAKQPPTADQIDDILSPVANMPAPGARVPTDVTSDIGQMTMGHWLEPNAAAVVDRPYTGQGPQSSDDPDLQKTYTTTFDPTASDKHLARVDNLVTNVPKDAATMLRAVLARQAMSRSGQ